VNVPMSVLAYCDLEGLEYEQYVTRCISDLTFDFADAIKAARDNMLTATSEHADQDLAIVRVREAEIVLDWLRGRLAAIQATTHEHAVMLNATPASSLPKV